MINEKLIFDAAKNGKYQTLESIFNNYPDAVKLTDSNGDSLLMIAVRHGHNYAAINLIDKVDLSIQNKNGDTAITLSTSLNNNYITVNLLSAMTNKDLLLKNKSGDNCLLIAARKGNNYLVSNLIQKGGKDFINAQDTHGYTALTLAAEHNNNYMLAQLIEAGANPYIKNNKGKNAYEYTLEHQNNYAMSLYNNSKYSLVKNNQGDSEESRIVEKSTFLDKIKLLIERFMLSIFGREKVEQKDKEEKKSITIKGVEVQDIYQFINTPLDFKNKQIDLGLHSKMLEQLQSVLNKARNNESLIEMESIVSLKDKIINVIQLHQRVDELSEQIKEENIKSHSLELQGIYNDIITDISDLENTIDEALLKDFSKEIKIHKTMYARK